MNKNEYGLIKKHRKEVLEKFKFYSFQGDVKKIAASNGFNYGSFRLFFIKKFNYNLFSYNKANKILEILEQQNEANVTARSSRGDTGKV